MMIKLIFWLLSLTKTQDSDVNQGFTLIEVIVAIVILSIFILTSLTALVAGLNFKLRAQLTNEATLIINQDLEQFRYVASQLGVETVKSAPSTPANGTGSISGTTLSFTLDVVNDGTNYLSSSTAGSLLKIGNETTAYRLTSTTVSSVTVTADLTKINKNASTLGLPLTTSTSLTSITVANSSVFQPGDRVVVGPVSGNILSFVVTAVNQSANTISFAAVNNTQSYLADTSVVALPRTGDVIPNTSLCSGTSTIFNSLLTDAPNKTNQTVTFNGRNTYQITRTTTQINTTSTDPAVSRASAKVVYSVRDTAFSTSSNLATLTTEVIPNVAFSCP
jgi:prepilin-type N-terminal cleavage/methylation domain-containing protein